MASQKSPRGAAMPHLFLTLTLDSQDLINNQSYVTARLFAKLLDGASCSDASANTWAIKLKGFTLTSGSNNGWSIASQNGEFEFARHTLVPGHDENGDATVTVTGEQNSWMFPNFTLTETLVLPRIEQGRIYVRAASTAGAPVRGQVYVRAATTAGAPSKAKAVYVGDASGVPKKAK